MASKSYNTLRSRIGNFRHPQGTRLISRQVSREIGSRGTARLATLFSCNSNHRTPNTDGQRSMAQDISPRDVNSLVFKTPSAEVRCHVLALHVVLWDPSQFETSLLLRVPFDFENVEVPSLNSSGSCATCPSNDRRPRQIREIATHDFNG
jgi:hypothetical protein